MLNVIAWISVVVVCGIFAYCALAVMLLFAGIVLPGVTL